MKNKPNKDTIAAMAELSTSKVFMNAKGQFLFFSRREIGGFSSGSHWCYEWRDSIHEATVAQYIPYSRMDKWAHNVNPKSQVVAELNASVETIRTVTLLGPQE